MGVVNADAKDNKRCCDSIINGHDYQLKDLSSLRVSETASFWDNIFFSRKYSATRKGLGLSNLFSSAKGLQKSELIYLNVRALFTCHSGLYPNEIQNECQATGTYVSTWVPVDLYLFSPSSIIPSFPEKRQKS